MKKKLFKKKMNKKIEKFYKLHSEIVNLVNEFTSKEENKFTIDTNYDDTIRKMEDFCFTYAWVIDHLNDLKPIADVNNKDYKKSMTKKIRKALGYTI